MQTKKVVRNARYGGYSLSQKAYHALEDLFWEKGRDFEKYAPDLRDLLRDDEDLIKVIEEIGIEEASGYHTRLKIVEIPIEAKFIIKEYDGMEWIELV